MMNDKRRILFGTILLSGALTLGLYGMGKSIASGYEERYHDDDHEAFEFDDDDHYFQTRRSAQPEIYREECGSCHIAYPARFLPSQSWQMMLDGLEDHFGENAELDDETRQQIETYLVKTSQTGSYRKIAVTSSGQWPLRITELRGFKSEHNEIPQRLIDGNDKIRSLSQCDSCHKDAPRGYFDEDRIVIPGYGRWDD